MIPHDNFTPHGYLDNPYHSWKLNPSGVLRSQPPLGMGWHTPNLGSYVRNQFQYTAHLAIGLKIGKLTLLTAEDFKRHGCEIVSHLHTRNRFEYTCFVPAYALTLTACYFLISEHTLGCMLSLSTTNKQSIPVTCYVLHLHTHNPYTSRLWEHGLYARAILGGSCAMLGLASEGDVFLHGAEVADAGPVPAFGTMGYATDLEEIASWARGATIPQPAITQQQEGTGWQTRAIALPCTMEVGGETTGTRTLHLALARGVSLDQAYAHWREGIENIIVAERSRLEADEQFWSQAPQLSGDWPAHWRRGLVYDLETLRMVMRPASGVLHHPFDGMQIQAPRLVLAEAAMDALFLSYADPALAAEVILGHFESAPHANLPCMREDGSYNMVADDGQICGTAPAWGYPIWCCDQLFRRTGDLAWLRRLYPGVAAYLRWWLDNRRDPAGWLVYNCSWESGQDVSSRFGPQQTGGTIIQHVRPVDLQASMAQNAKIASTWAQVLGQNPAPSDALDFASEATTWRAVADEFTEKTRQMWQGGWFRDYDSAAQEWSSQQDVMHLSPVFCGVADQEHQEQLRPYFVQPPGHSSGWEPLSWPPVVMTLIGAAASAQLPAEAAELSYQFIDAACRSSDAREPDEHGGIPGVTREYHATVGRDKWGQVTYTNAGIEGYGWGALSIHLLLRYLLGLVEQDAHTLTVAPLLPKALRRVGATYHAGPLAWGTHLLHIECTVLDRERFGMHIRCSSRDGQAAIQAPETAEQQWEWQGGWGDAHTLLLP